MCDTTVVEFWMVLGMNLVKGGNEIVIASFGRSRAEALKRAYTAVDADTLCRAFLLNQTSRQLGLQMRDWFTVMKVPSSQVNQCVRLVARELKKAFRKR
jgi:hypothetical protein